MYLKIKKLVRKSKGMEALQAVLLIGAAFVVVWSLITTWNTVIQPLLQGNVENTINGVPNAKAPGEKKTP